MISKKVKARKNHKCEICNGIIHKGEIYNYDSGRQPRYSDDYYEEQIGIEFWNMKSHAKECTPRLPNLEYKEVLKYCNKGKHSYVENYELAYYVDGHSVGEPTGEWFCEWCDKLKESK